MNCSPHRSSFIICITVALLLFAGMPGSALGQGKEEPTNPPTSTVPEISVVSEGNGILGKRLMISTFGCVAAFGAQDSECFDAPFALVEVRWLHPDNPFNTGPITEEFSFLPSGEPGSGIDEGAGFTYANDRNSGPIPHGAAQGRNGNEGEGEAFLASKSASILNDPLANIPELYHGGMNSYTFEYARFLNRPPLFGLEKYLNLQLFVGFGFARTTKDMSRNEDRYITLDYERAFPMFSYGLDLGISLLRSERAQLRLKLRGQTYMPPNRLEYMLIENIDAQRVVTPFTSRTSSFTKIDFLIGAAVLL